MRCSSSQGKRVVLQDDEYQLGLAENHAPASRQSVITAEKMTGAMKKYRQLKIVVSSIDRLGMEIAIIHNIGAGFGHRP
jgi:hypothetical protein